MTVSLNDKVLTTLSVTNRADQILATRKFIPVDYVRYITATTLCLPGEAITK
jgi:hypothetical protein